MKIHLLLLVCIVLFWRQEVKAEFDNEIRRGAFPFMAVIYYPDESIVDSIGARFQHAAVLVKPQWLISAAIDHSVLDNVPLGFPRKTLLARLGAITLDANYTLNEDEDEQEREVIQVVRPSNHNTETWWQTDITLLQTLLPFKLTSAVTPTPVASKSNFSDKNCLILVFARKKPNSDDKVLIQIGVELFPPSAENCGSFFKANSMTCAVQAEESKAALNDPEFCQGNSGGPLLCEGEVMGLQTYIENNCKQPHLYQLLHYWDTFITCGTEEKCNPTDAVCNVCTAVNKDAPPTDDTPGTRSTTVEYNMTTVNATESTIPPTSPPTSSQDTKPSSTASEANSEEPERTSEHVSVEPRVSETTTDMVVETIPPETTATTESTETATETAQETTKEETSSSESTSEASSEAASTQASTETTRQKLFWPHFKSTSSDEESSRDVEVEVEAQRAIDKTTTKHPTHLKSGSTKTALNYLLISFPVIVYFI